LQVQSAPQVHTSAVVPSIQTTWPVFIGFPSGQVPGVLLIPEQTPSMALPHQ
jgi:hypothetical protein